MLANFRSIFNLSLCCLIVFSFIACSKKAPEAKQEKAINVKFKPAELGAITEEFSTAGELKAAEDVIVAAQRPGRIIAINVREGEYVQKGQVLIEIAGKDVDADLAKARQDFVSYKKLFEEGAISQLELNNYQAQLDKLSSFKNDLVIKAQISGQVGEIMIDEGDYVKEGADILDLVKLYPMELTYTIPERLLARVKIGQQVVLTTDAHPGKEFYAKVKFISPKVDPQTRATLVRANLEATDLTLKANQYVNVRQILNLNEGILLIPEEAIYLDQGQEYVFIATELEKDDDNKEQEAQAPGPPPPTHMAHKQKVTVGLRKPGYVQIIDGVNEGDNVIYAGLTSIYHGAKLIQVKEN